jgi:hypothetical protein
MRERDAKQHGGTVHMRKDAFKGYCGGLGFTVWCIYSKRWECTCRQARPCCEKGQTRRGWGG